MAKIFFGRTKGNLVLKKSIRTASPPLGTSSVWEEIFVETNELLSPETPVSYTHPSIDLAEAGILIESVSQCEKNTLNDVVVVTTSTSGTKRKTEQESSQTLPQGQKPQSAGKLNKMASVLRQERNKYQSGTKKAKASELEGLVNTCSKLGADISNILKENSDMVQKDLEALNREDFYFAMSIVQSMQKTKNEKEKLLLKAKFIVDIANVVEREDGATNSPM